MKRHCACDVKSSLEKKLRLSELRAGGERGKKGRRTFCGREFLSLTDIVVADIFKKNKGSTEFF